MTCYFHDGLRSWSSSACLSIMETPWYLTKCISEDLMTWVGLPCCLNGHVLTKANSVKGYGWSKWLSLNDGPEKKRRSSRRALETCQQNLEKLLSTPQTQRQMWKQMEDLQRDGCHQEEQWKRSGVLPGGLWILHRAQIRAEEAHMLTIFLYERGLEHKIERPEACSGLYFCLPNIHSSFNGVSSCFLLVNLFSYTQIMLVRWGCGVLPSAPGIEMYLLNGSENHIIPETIFFLR